jgi:hypothetical protein
MFNWSYRWLPVSTVLLFSLALIALAAFAESCVQGPSMVPGDLNFTAYLPGVYSLYQESLVKNKTKADENVDQPLNAIVKCTVVGAGHLHVLTSSVEFAGGRPYVHLDKKLGQYRVGKPFAKFEILWPGHYKLQLEGLNKDADGLCVTAGPDGLITIAVAISIIAQIIVLFIILRK